MPNRRDLHQEREDADWTARARQLSCLVGRVASNTRSMKSDQSQGAYCVEIQRTDLLHTHFGLATKKSQARQRKKNRSMPE
jgi:hypothetical protein